MLSFSSVGLLTLGLTELLISKYYVLKNSRTSSSCKTEIL